MSPEKAFWTERKQMAEQVLSQMKSDMSRMPNLMKFQEAVIKLCEEHIKSLK